jgi:hypothetical protein
MKITQNRPVGFSPITITIESERELADLVGALGAYGKGVTLAKKTIREAGLGASYSGNARKTARNIVGALVKAAGKTCPNFGFGKSPDSSFVASTVVNSGSGSTGSRW